MTKSKRRKRIRLALAVFWLAVVAWLFLNMQARGVDASVLKSGPVVTVSTTSATLTFTPTANTAATGLLFYSGALVDPEAYAPMARDIAEAGFEVIVVKPPFRLAPFERHREELFRRTRELIQATDDRVAGGGVAGGRREWVIGGHSKGGALAAAFARDHESDVAGLLLVGTSHPREDDLSGLGLDVTKIYGSEDGLASEAEVLQFAPNLPDSTHFVRIEGGNHAQFGWYGWQLGGGRAGISRSEQHAMTVRSILDQLRRIDNIEKGSNGTQH